MGSITQLSCWFVLFLLWASHAQQQTTPPRPGPQSPVEVFAEQLLASRDRARSTLLEDNKELVTDELLRVVLRRADRMRDQGRYEPAMEHYRLADSIGRRIGHRPSVAEALLGIGFIQRVQGKYAEALGCFKEALGEAKAVQSQTLSAHAHRGIGAVHYLQGDYVNAQAHYEHALILARQLQDFGQLWRILANLGALFESQGSVERALATHHESLEHARRAADDEGNSTCVTRHRERASPLEPL